MVERKIKQPFKKIRKSTALFADKAKLAVVGGSFLLRKPKYAWSFGVIFLVFAYLLSLFRDGSSNWQLLWSGISASQKWAIIGRGFCNILFDFTSLYGILIIFMSLLQALCLIFLVFAWRHREKDSAIDGASTGTIASILGFVALGCPSCGVTLLAPVFAALAGAGAMTLAESASRVFMVIAFLLLIYTVVQLGYVAFVIMSAAKYKEKHEKSN